MPSTSRPTWPRPRGPDESQDAPRPDWPEPQPSPCWPRAAAAAAARLPQRAHRARAQAHGHAVFTVDVERLHFFDPETGLAIG
jgi:hypothetical protein